MKLSASSLRVLAALLSECQQGRTPTVPELVRLCGWTGLGWVPECLKKLEKAGLIDWQSQKARTLRPRCRMWIFEEQNHAPTAHS